MRKLFTVAVVFTSLGLLLGFYLRGGSPTASAEKCSSRNGDVNADGDVDLSDAVTILGNLFLGNPSELKVLCSSLPPPTGLPDTGQANCYDLLGPEASCGSNALCPGQDGFHATGCPTEGRFTDNGDGTVTDRCTALMWQKDPADLDGDGVPSGRDGLLWCEALRYCESLSFAGHDDWRLPNVRELQSLVDYGRSKPSIDPVFGAILAQYWSSSSFAVNPSRAWFVGFYEGVVTFDESLFHEYVRAVRNAP